MAKSVIENESIIAEQPLHVQYDSLVSMSRTHTYVLYYVRAYLGFRVTRKFVEKKTKFGIFSQSPEEYSYEIRVVLY